MKVINNVNELLEEIKTGDVFYDTELKVYCMLTSVGGSYGNYRYSIIDLGSQGCFQSNNTAQLSWDDVVGKIKDMMKANRLEHYPKSKYGFTLTIESK